LDTGFCYRPSKVIEAHDGTALPDGDLIAVTITRGEVDPSTVQFLLELGAAVDWWKRINVPDGQGSSWDIWAQGPFGQRIGDDGVSLWSGQVNNGQVLTFGKAKFAGEHCDIYRLGDLGRIAPGSRVHFEWMRD
jgi:hypothetical protein